MPPLSQLHTQQLANVCELDYENEKTFFSDSPISAPDGPPPIHPFLSPTPSPQICRSTILTLMSQLCLDSKGDPSGSYQGANLNELFVFQ